MVQYSESIPDFTNVIVGNRRYRCVKELGSGAFGVVYSAVDLRTPTSSTAPAAQYAIKILSKVDSRIPSTRRGIHPVTELQAREISNHQTVSSHPSIVTLHETFCDESFTYLVLDFCPTNMFTLISTRKTYWRDDAKVKKVFLQILEAVQFMHSKSVFHRDLKPDNILCSEDGETVYVTDFGLSTTNFVSASTGCGSAVYMSPECLGEDYDNEAYSPRHADIWSLGVVLINILVSRHPWEIASTRDPAFRDYVTDDQFFLGMFPISKSANRLLRRMMKFNPLSRISIGAIRIAVEDMDTFFMTDEELNGSLGTRCNRRIAHEGYAALFAKNHLPVPEKTRVSIVPPCEEVDITSVLLSSRRGLSESNKDRESRSFLKDSSVKVEYFKPHTPSRGRVVPGERNEEELAILRYKWANTPIKLDVENIMGVGNINLDVETSEEAKKAQRSGLPFAKRYDEYIHGGEGEFVIGSLSSGPDSSGPITPQSHAVDPDIQLEDFPPLTNPYSVEYQDSVEVDLGTEGVHLKEDFLDHDAQGIQDPPLTKDAPLHVLRACSGIDIDDQGKPEKRKWFVRDFRRLRLRV